jgi:hypothetical protein
MSMQNWQNRAFMGEVGVIREYDIPSKRDPLAMPALRSVLR